MDIKNKTPSNFKAEASKILVGSVVLTRYNNKPYRVDDIAYDLNPTKTFEKSDGSSISYIEYFKNNWGIDIKDNAQPLLVNRPKPKRGQTTVSTAIYIYNQKLTFILGTSRHHAYS